MALRISDDDIDLKPSQSKYDRSISDIEKREKEGTFDSSSKNHNNSADLEKSEEQSANGLYNPTGGNENGPREKFDKIAFLKRKGPVAGIIVTLVAVISGLIGLAGPSLIIVHFSETLVKSLYDAGPALNQRSIRLMALKANSVKNGFAESTEGKCGIRCKFGTINESMLRNLRAKGFTVDTGDKKFGGRYVIKSMVFPGDTKILTSGSDFSDALKDPSKAYQFRRVFNSKTAFFLNSKFGSFLKTTFGLDKLAKVTGKTKEAAKASFRKAMGLPEAKTPTPTTRAELNEKARTGRFKNVFTATDILGSKAYSKSTNIIGGACLAFNSGKRVSYAIKAAKMAAFASIAFAIMNMASQIKAGANPDSAAVEVVADALAQPDMRKTITDIDGNTKPNPYYGKTSTDSLGYQIDSDSNNSSNLSEEDQKYAIAPVSAIGSAISDVTSVLLTGGVTTLLAAKAICKTANDPVLATLSTCGEQIVAALATAAETVGVGAVASALWCVGKVVATVITLGTIINIAIDTITKNIVSSEPIDLDEDTVGPPIGNASHSGGASVLGGASAIYGLHAGTKEQIKEYALNSYSINANDDAIARYEAKNKPFDIYDQYSFLGSFARNIGLSSMLNSSVSSSVNKIASLLPKSLSILSTSVGALSAEEVANKKASLYGNCSDPALSSVGVVGDAFCNPSYVMTSKELGMETNDVLDYMTGHGYIDKDTGEATPGSPYEKYLDNCANRVDPLGETASTIEEDDYEWKVGLLCSVESTEMENFHVYTMDKSINDTMDDDIDETSNQTAATYAKQILDSGNVSAWADDPDDGDGSRSEMDQIQAVADGTASKECSIDPRLLKMIADLSKKHTMVISDLNRICSKSSIPYSTGGHYDSPARAVDFDKVDGNSDPESDIAFINEAMSYVEKGNTVRVGQVNQRGAGKLSPPDGVRVYEFDDSAGHLHIAIE